MYTPGSEAGDRNTCSGDVLLQTSGITKGAPPLWHVSLA